MDVLITPIDWRRIGAVFTEAMELEPDRRVEFVRAAEGDDFICTEVMRLLASDRVASGFLEFPIALDELTSRPGSGSLGDDTATRTLTRIGPGRGLPTSAVYSEGDLLSGRFRIVRMLGTGGMGEVFEAEDLLASGARIALKTISARLDRSPKNREAFRVEVLAARAVTHPGVCRIHDLHDDPARDCIFLTMELLEGRNLSTVIRERKKVAFAEAAQLFLRITEAVAAAHRAGILHCDIKLSNVILVADQQGSRPVVTDFGLARLAEGSTSHVGGGTLDYMAPELFRGAPPSFGSDVYALGVLAVELLTGERLPHQLSDLTGLSSSSRNTALPAALHRGDWGKLVGRCLDRDPSRRYHSAVELSEAIDHLIHRSARLTRRFVLATFLVGPLAAYYTYEHSRPAAQTGVAILPFEDDSPQHGNQFLADSLPGELIRALSPVPGLRVTALTSTSRYRDPSRSPVDVAQRLNVDYVVRGKVRTENGNIVLNIEAVSGKTGRLEWNDEFRHSAGDNLAMRQEVVMAVAGALPFALAPAQLTKLRGQPTSNAAAYDKYLLGMQLASTRTPENLQSAIELLNEAGQMDPGFALAFAQLSSVCVVLGSRHGFSSHELLRRSEAAAERALQLDNSLPEAHLAMGAMRQRKYFDWAGAESELRAATRLNPGLSTAHQALAFLFSNLRRGPEAMAEIRLAKRLDPASLQVITLYGSILTRGNQTDEAIQQLELATEFSSAYAPAWTLLGFAWAHKAGWNEAEAAFKRSSALNPSDDFSVAGLAAVYARTGRLDEANALLEKLIQQRASPVALANVYEAMSRYDDAIQCLETAWRQRDPNIITVAAEPANESLRQFPRFTRLLKEMSLP